MSWEQTKNKINNTGITLLNVWIERIKKQIYEGKLKTVSTTEGYDGLEAFKLIVGDIILKIEAKVRL